MNHFVAASFAPSAAGMVMKQQFTQDAPSIIRSIVDTPEPCVLEPAADLVVALSFTGSDRIVSRPDGAVCAIPPQACYGTQPWKKHEPSAVLNAYELSGHLDDLSLAPPFNAMLYSPARGAAVFTDECGLQQVFIAQRPEWAIAASSLLVAGRILQAVLDWEGIAVWMRVGHLLPSCTFFADVRKLLPNHVCRLERGRLQVESRTKARWIPQRSHGNEDIRRGIDIVRDSVKGCLSLFPEASIELSGGVDSRLVLSAIPAAARAGRTAITIGNADSRDVQVARELAARDGMQHVVVPFEFVGDTSLEDFLASAERTARFGDYLTDPLFAFLLDRVHRSVGFKPRLTGQGGEIGRGFYYTGQRSSTTGDRETAAKLARWRIMTRDVFGPHLLSPAFAKWSDEVALNTIVDELLSAEGDWLRKTDQFYLNARMQCGVGPAVSAASTKRIILAPFFHSNYVRWADSLRRPENQGKTYFAKMILLLDPGMADIPLADGTMPRCIGETQWRARLSARMLFFKKALVRLKRRVLRTPSTPIGTDMLLAHLLTQCRDPWILFPRVAQAGLLSEGGRQVSLDANSFGSFLRLEWLLRFSSHLQSPSWKPSG